MLTQPGVAAGCELTVTEYLAREANHQGVCFLCEAWTPGVDPAAARLRCPVCGQRGVHGVDQALLLGYLRLTR